MRCKAFEQATEMVGVSIADCYGHLIDLACGIFQQGLGCFDPLLLQVCEWRFTRCLPEPPMEISRAHIESLCDVVEIHICLITLIQPVLHQMNLRITVYAVMHDTGIGGLVRAVRIQDQRPCGFLFHLGTAKFLDDEQGQIIPGVAAAAGQDIAVFDEKLIPLDFNRGIQLAEIMQGPPVSGRLFAVQQAGFGQQPETRADGCDYGSFVMGPLQPVDNCTIPVGFGLYVGATGSDHHNIRLVQILEPGIGVDLQPVQESNRLPVMGCQRHLKQLFARLAGQATKGASGRVEDFKRADNCRRAAAGLHVDHDFKHNVPLMHPVPGFRLAVRL